MALVASNTSPDMDPPAQSRSSSQQQPNADSTEAQHDSSSSAGKPPSFSPAQGLLSVSFNQDQSCFACAMNSGFRIFNCEPLKETIRRDFNGGIGIVEMLFKCNFLALVGGGENPRHSPNKVMIWDDNQGRCIGELTFRSEVRAVRLRRDKIVVVLEHKIYVYNFADLKLLHQIETLSNIKGLCVISQASTNTVMACPGTQKGQVRVDFFEGKRTRYILAHDSSIACLALTSDGKRLATASSKGTLVRIWDTSDGSQLQELRRGSDRADIYSITFSPTAHFLALCSDKGTVHVFALSCPTDGADEAKAAAAAAAQQQSAAGKGQAGQAANPSTSLAFMKGVLPRYFSSEWSFAQCHLPEETKAYVAFGAAKQTLLVVAADGRFYRLHFDPSRQGEMDRKECSKFLEDEGEY